MDTTLSSPEALVGSLVGAAAAGWVAWSLVRPRQRRTVRVRTRRRRR